MKTNEQRNRHQLHQIRGAMKFVIHEYKQEQMKEEHFALNACAVKVLASIRSLDDEYLPEAKKIIDEMLGVYLLPPETRDSANSGRSNETTSS